MTTEPVRAGSAWLALREPSDAAARASELVDALRPRLPVGGAEIRDLGCGTGSMARWLAARLSGPQHWVLYDRDAELLAQAAADPPGEAADGAAVAVETRRRDITRLEPQELAGADLITASALLDMLTPGELDRLVSACVRAGCPVLLTLSVVGLVDLTPADPFDRRVRDAFNAHQRRAHGPDRLLGPDAARAAADAFTRWGHDVVVRASPWRLGPDRSALAVEWFTGWLAAACEQRPELREEADAYARRRLSQVAAGALTVTVHHQDLLARPTPATKAAGGASRRV
jgi:SAM-dependent methyltransferase